MSRSKLCAGGGEDVAHSRVFASQGSSLAVGGFRMLMMKLTMKISTESAIRKEPSVAIWL